MVETQKDAIYPIFYLLMKLVLTFPVMNATIEKSFLFLFFYFLFFFVMKYIKNELCNWMRDQWMNNCLVVYIERDVAGSIDNEAIMQQL